MKNASILGGVALAVTCAGATSTDAGSQSQPWESRIIGAPPSQPYASPGLYRSGNECAPDRAQAEWDRNYKFLGYACVRSSPNVR
jgi:hypothetical protein